MYFGVNLNIFKYQDVHHVCSSLDLNQSPDDLNCRWFLASSREQQGGLFIYLFYLFINHLQQNIKNIL